MKNKILSLIIVLIFLIGTFNINVMANSLYNNPFPEAISDQEIQEAKEKFDNTADSQKKFTFISKTFLVRNNHLTKIEGGSTNAMNGDKIRHYVAIIGQSVYSGAYAEYTISSPSVYIPKGDGDRIAAEYLTDKSSKLDLQVKILPDANEDTIIKTNTNNELKIRFNHVNQIKYILVETDVKSAEKFSSLDLANPGMTASANQGGSASTSFYFFKGPFSLVTTNFHYVDDLAYRRLNGLGINDEIFERSLNDGKDSNKAHYRLELQDLIDPVSSQTLFGRGTSFLSSAEIPFLRVDDGSEIEVYEPNLETGVGFTDVKKPSLADLESKMSSSNIVYVGNDIDQKHDDSNNHMAIFGIVDGKISDNKHYYLRYVAKQPSVLNIKKLDKDSGKPLKNAKFELYFINEKNEEVLIKDNLVSDDNGYIHLSSNNDISADFENGYPKNGAGKIELAKNIYVKGEDIFLYPGNYRIKEISAPEGYKLNESAYDFSIKHNLENFNVELELTNEALPKDEEPNKPVTPPKDEEPNKPVTPSIDNNPVVPIIKIEVPIKLPATGVK